MSRPLVQILGAGPAGLAAAHAVELAARAAGLGSRPIIVIYSTRRGPSPLHGAQYLHEPLPQLGYISESHNAVKVSYRMQGDPKSYRDKVYGAGWTGTVSPEDLPEEHDAWDIRETYRELWRRYSRYVMSDIPPIEPADMPLVLREATLTISTVPATALCSGYNVDNPVGMLAPHSFTAQVIYALGEAAGGTPITVPCPDNTVICNGDQEPAWYRISNIFGHKTMEWPEGSRPPISGVARVEKPLQTSCDCWTGDNYLRAGRYGRWEKGVLVHDAFNGAYDWIKEKL